MGHNPVKRRAKRKAKPKLHAVRDREICRARKRKKFSHSRLAKDYKLTQSRISQILKDGGCYGIRTPYDKREKPKPREAPTKPKESKESASERAWFKRWERHCPFLNGLK